MRSFDFAPLYRATVGFDRIADLMDRALNAEGTQPTYPPYNIEKTAEDAYRISIAVAGFGPDDLTVEMRDGGLHVAARKAPEVANPAYLHRELALPEGEAQPEAILRAARLVGLKARLIEKLTAARLSTLPTPCILRLRDGGYVVFGGVNKESQARIVDPLTRADRILPLDELMVEIEPIAILVARRLGGGWGGVDETRRFG